MTAESLVSSRQMIRHLKTKLCFRDSMLIERNKTIVQLEQQVLELKEKGWIGLVNSELLTGFNRR